MNHERDDDGDFLRLPGFFLRSEIEQVLKSGRDYHILEVGETKGGSRLWNVYEWTPREPASDTDRFVLDLRKRMDRILQG